MKNNAEQESKPFIKANFDRLQTSIDWSIQQLATPRENRVGAIRQYVGSNYSQDGTDEKVPTNFLELACTIYTRQLAARAPRAMISADNEALRPAARNMELAVNQIPEEINLGQTLRRAVLDAIFGFAVVKVGICTSGTKILGQEYGKAFAELVSFSDYFCDMSVKHRSLMQYEGNDYWVSLDVARAMYDGEGSARDIQRDEHTLVGNQGEDRAESITVSEGTDLYEDRVWLRDVWLPAERKLLTYGVKSKKLFRVVEWDGPEEGPYHVLGFSDVPDNLLPLPPVALWRDLNELANNLFRKLGRQAQAKKTVALFGGGNDDDVQGLKNAKDGEGIRYGGQKPEQLTVGGIDAPTLAFFIQSKDLFSYLAGNLDTLGGLSPQTDTVGQDKMLSEAASSRVKSMAEQTIDFARGIFRALAWYDWTDPVRKRTIQKPVKGTNIVLKREWSKATRKGEFLDFNFNIDVYSMQDDSPSTKLQKIAMALERFVFPMMEGMQTQGGQIDYQKMIELVARFGNIPELNDIVRFEMPAEERPVKGEATPEKAGKPAHTTRTYERVNRPGATRAGKDDVMTRLLMGGNAQNAEVAALGRAVS